MVKSGKLRNAYHNLPLNCTVSTCNLNETPRDDVRHDHPWLSAGIWGGEKKTNWAAEY